MEDITVCTSTNCTYRNKCERRIRDDPDDINQTYFNYEYICNENSAYQSFIPILTD